MDKLNRDKYINTILFFSENIPDLGKTKLFKLLYYLDFDHFEKHGRPVTGDAYENKQLGPVPQHAEAILAEMEEQGLIEIMTEQVIDYVRFHLHAKTSHDTSVFLPDEIEMLCGIKDKWYHHTAKEIVDASHGEAPWIATRLGELIPYQLAYYRCKYEEPTFDSEPIEISQ